MDLHSSSPSTRMPIPFKFGPTAWYDRGMTKFSKITISLPPEQLEQVREAVARGEAASVSGYISAALLAVTPVVGPEDEETLADFAADLIAEDGEPSAEAYAWADRVLALSEPD
jgi:Arc/MetJ-type ribon-helix-helix transcriptional regulator